MKATKVPKERSAGHLCGMGLVIGPFLLTSYDDEHVWISHVSGEGGAFPKDEVMEVLAKPKRQEAVEQYYGEKF